MDQPQTSNYKKNYTILFIAIATALLIGGFLGFAISKKIDSNASKKAYENGWNDAKKRVSESGLVPAIPEGMPIKTINGVVESTSENEIVMKSNPLAIFSDPKLDMRTVMIDKNTKIYSIKQKDPKEFEKELAEYTKNLKTNTGAEQKTIPEPFLRVETKLADIAKGVRVSITAVNDIKNEQKFTAESIDIQLGDPTPPSGQK
ncbi:hypothetical protein HY249_00270 [Candidatus Azambacteria bacterium]|nr:hypothetical protein [Candidatus Azambacteria bacterium]